MEVVYYSKCVTKTDVVLWTTTKELTRIFGNQNIRDGWKGKTENGCRFFITLSSIFTQDSSGPIPWEISSDDVDNAAEIISNIHSRLFASKSLN